MELFIISALTSLSIENKNSGQDTPTSSVSHCGNAKPLAAEEFAHADGLAEKADKNT